MLCLKHQVPDLYLNVFERGRSSILLLIPFLCQAEVQMDPEKAHSAKSPSVGTNRKSNLRSRLSSLNLESRCRDRPCVRKFARSSAEKQPLRCRLTLNYPESGLSFVRSPLKFTKMRHEKRKCDPPGKGCSPQGCFALQLWGAKMFRGCQQRFAFAFSRQCLVFCAALFQ